MANVVFVAPYALDATTRFVEAVAEQPDARVGLISSDPLERFPEAARSRLAAHWRIDNCLDPDALTEAVAAIGSRIPPGRVDRLLAILENLQVPLAEVRERLGIEGMGVDVAQNFRDKGRMKAVMAGAGVPCARNREASGADAARAFVADVGFPVVAKPPAGMGARNTFRLDDGSQLEHWLEASPPTRGDPVLLEEFLVGDEHSFDSVVVDGRLVWSSISRYLPTPLEVLENPWIQWCVLLPHSMDGSGAGDIEPIAARAIAALGLRTGLSHMEWFRRPDGSVAVSEVGARPPGAQFMTLLSWAHDTDMYAAWAGLAIHEHFEPPKRSFAVGAAYLRAQGREGQGRAITGVHGLEGLSRATRSLVVDARLPEAGRPPADTYEGDGYVIVRHPDTGAVEQALAELITSIRIESG
jgi:formate-dependent phosphoribosylglycinamide formyltransferase (GAR transformylase)